MPSRSVRKLPSLGGLHQPPWLVHFAIFQQIRADSGTLSLTTITTSHDVRSSVSNFYCWDTNRSDVARAVGKVDEELRGAAMCPGVRAAKPERAVALHVA